MEFKLSAFIDKETFPKSIWLNPSST